MSACIPLGNATYGDSPDSRTMIASWRRLGSAALAVAARQRPAAPAAHRLRLSRRRPAGHHVRGHRRRAVSRRRDQGRYVSGGGVQADGRRTTTKPLTPKQVNDLREKAARAAARSSTSDRRASAKRDRRTIRKQARRDRSDQPRQSGHRRDGHAAGHDRRRRRARPARAAAGDGHRRCPIRWSSTSANCPSSPSRKPNASTPGGRGPLPRARQPRARTETDVTLPAVRQRPDHARRRGPLSASRPARGSSWSSPPARGS